MKRPPRGISEEDWANTPDLVRRFISALLKPKKLKNNFPTWFVLFINAVIIGGSAYSLRDKVIFPCVTPPFASWLSLVLFFVTLIHFAWRYIYKNVPRPSRGEHLVNFSIGGVAFQFDRNIIIALLNETQPWKLSSHLLGISLLIFFLAGLFLNLSPDSPFFKGGGPFVIQSFEVQRLSLASPEHLAPDETLTLRAGEKVILEVVLLGDTQVSCTWFTAMKGNNTKTGCSIAYSAFSAGEPDSLTVFVRPTCGLHQESASLFVAIQP